MAVTAKVSIYNILHTLSRLGDQLGRDKAHSLPHDEETEALSRIVVEALGARESKEGACMGFHLRRAAEQSLAHKVDQDKQLGGFV